MTTLRPTASHRDSPCRPARPWSVTGVLVAALLAAGTAVAAEQPATLTLRRFELLDQLSGAAESSEINAYLRAVGDSLEIANSTLAAGGRERLFCADRPLDVPTLRRLLRARIAFLSQLGQDTEAVKARSGVVVAILQALREAYPCR